MKDKSKKQSDAAGVAPPHAQPDARGLRVGLVVSTYHSEITSALEAGARSAYQNAGGVEADLLVVHAPGAFELPVLAAALLRRPDVAAVVVLGCVVQGQTRHDRYICTAVTDQCSRLAVETGKPLGYGLLTVNDLKQARARAGGRHGNKGAEAMHAALCTVRTLEGVRR